MIMVNLDVNARSPLADVIRSKRFLEVGRVRRLGFEATDEVETILTLARHLSADRLEGLVDWALAPSSSDRGPSAARCLSTTDQ